MSKHITFKPSGVCSVQIDFDLDGEGRRRSQISSGEMTAREGEPPVRTSWQRLSIRHWQRHRK